TRETADPSDISKSSKWTEPKPGEEVPNFNLVNQSGKRLSFRDYKGNAVIVTFIYTRCPLPDYCPLMTENFSQILAALKSESEKYLKTHLLSITLDPEYDSPKVLSEYAAAYSADLERWDFATGTKDEIKKVATYFGLQYWTEGDQVIHSLRTAIVGSDGRLIKLYRGNEWKPDEILKELRITPPTPTEPHPPETGTPNRTLNRLERQRLCAVCGSLPQIHPQIAQINLSSLIRFFLTRVHNSDILAHAETNCSILFIHSRAGLLQ